MGSVELTEEEYAKEILVLLQDMDIISDFMLESCYEYFHYASDKRYLDNEEKCLMAYYLSKMKIIYEDWNIDECNRIQSKLKDYYENNKSSCSKRVDEETQRYDNYLEKQTKLRKRKIIKVL